MTGTIYKKGVRIAKASHEITVLVTQNMKVHTIVDTVGIPAAAMLENASVSNNIIQRRIVIDGMRASRYGLVIQPDESKNVTKCCHLRSSNDEAQKYSLCNFGEHGLLVHDAMPSNCYHLHENAKRDS